MGRRSCFDCGTRADGTAFASQSSRRCRACDALAFAKYGPDATRGDKPATTTPPEQKAKSRRKQLAKYKLSPDQFVCMLEEQAGKCGVCGGIMSEPGSQPDSCVIDHNHHTNRVRALLHNHCNRMLGFAREVPKVLRQGAEYLERHAESDRQRLERWR